MTQQTLPRDEHTQSRVLLVEDDELVAAVTQAQLIALGYDVVVVDDPRESLRQFTAAPQAFALLLTNRDLPGMSGVELAAACRQQRPDLPIILCTGGPPPAELGVHIDAVLLKPYDKDALAETIDAVVHRGDRRRPAC